MTFAFIERAGGAARSATRASSRPRSPIRCRRSSRCCGRRCCPGCSTRARTTAAASGKDVRLFETGSRFTRRRARDARRRSSWCGAADGAALVGAGSRRSTSSTRRASSSAVLRRFGVAAVEFAPAARRSSSPAAPPRRDVPPTAPRVCSASSASWRRRSPRRAASRRAKTIYVAEIDLERLIALRRGRRRSAPSRCRASRRSCATSRSSSTKPCLLPRFVALSVRRPPRRWYRSSSSIAIRARACRTARVSLSLRLTFRAPERTLTDDEAQAATERIVDALQPRTARSS